MNTADLISVLVNGFPLAAFALVLISMFLSGKLHSDPEFQQMKTDLEVERKAHELTRSSLELARERSDVSILTSQLISRALRIGEGDGNLPKA